MKDILNNHKNTLVIDSKFIQRDIRKMYDKAEELSSLLKH